MNKLNYEILSAIDNIETTVMESEMNVMSSIINTYDKAVMILEHCDDNTDTSSYDIFQEGIGGKIGNAIDKLDDKMKAKPNENIIMKILLFIPRQIMRFIKFIRNKISKSKTLSPETINKAKQIVGDDTILITTTTTNSGGKPEVKVSSQSGDTQKEEEIKNNISKAHVVSFSTWEKSSETEIKVDEGEKVVEIKATKDNIMVAFNGYSNIIKFYQSKCKEFSELFRTINLERMGEPKYNQDFAEKVNEIYKSMINPDDIADQSLDEERAISYADFVRIYTQTHAGFEGIINTLELCRKTLEKSIETYKVKNKINNMPENAIKGESKDIIKSIKMMNRAFSTLLERVWQDSMDWAGQADKIDIMVEGLLESNNPDE